MSTEDRQPGRNPEWFAGRLRQLREGRGLTQAVLAERAGVTTDGIAKLERGDRKPTWETVLALCDVLGVDPNAFTERPAPRQPAGPGRPPKAEPTAESPEEPATMPGKAKKGRKKT
jgi:transcriptional regulator with XRE-family HTH domain